MDKAWNDFYIKHGRFYLLPHPFSERVANRFKTYEVRNVLDLGCGSGRELIFLAEKGFNVTGIDFSPSAVQLAKSWLKQKNLSGEVEVGEIGAHIAGTADSSFDAVIAINSLQYLTWQQFDSAITEINRVLKDGGLFWVVLPSENTKIDHASSAGEEKGQILFSEEKLKEKISKTFRVLEFSKDKEQAFSILAQEK
jgi:cyclopropane fatty-acyl-phospholipid synthase-like methyltransferase